MAYARVYIYMVVFKLRSGCGGMSAIHCWMQTVTSPTLPSSEGDGSVGAAKRHGAVRAHIITVSFSLIYGS